MLKENLIENENVKPNTKEMENLKLNFPQFFDKDGEFLLDRFKDMLKQNKVKFNKEGYELNFLGKSYAKYLSSTKTETFISPHVEENEKEENKESENLYIIGDNIDALKHLLGTYSGKVKMIYIDPPYNTGSDGFVYPDNFQYDPIKLSEMLGIDEEEAERIINLKGKSSHSAWLTFMYPRLVLARELLKEDGVIFISIDDNEQSNLKLMCDEVFGEENFVEQFLWNKSSGGSSLSKYTRNDFEYVLCYARNINDIKDKLVGKIAEGSSDSSLINQPNKFNKLLFRSGVINFLSTESGIIHKFSDDNFELYDDIIIENGINTNDVHIAAKWKWSQYYLDENIASGTKIISKTNNLRLRYLKDFTGNVITPTKSITKNDGVGYTVSGSAEISTLFPGSFFDFPKPTSLIKYLVKMITTKSDIILDFFSGSATTAHAVMQLNAEDGGNRKYILVQLPELIKEDKVAYKEGYKTIDEIGRERIRRASKKIKEETKAKIDYGFKTFSIVEPTNEVLTKLEEFEDNPKLLIEDMVKIYDTKYSSGKESILTTYLVLDGYGFVRSEKYILDKYVCDKVDKSIYIIEQGLESKDVSELIKRIENLELDINRIVVYSNSIVFNVMHELKKNISNLRNNKYVELVERY